MLRDMFLVGKQNLTHEVQARCSEEVTKSIKPRKLDIERTRYK